MVDEKDKDGDIGSTGEILDGDTHLERNATHTCGECGQEFPTYSAMINHYQISHKK